MKFKYVGHGDTPPEEINFMGKVKFKLNGPAVEVSDEFVIGKLTGNMCFQEVKQNKKA